MRALKFCPAEAIASSLGLAEAGGKLLIVMGEMGNAVPGVP